MTTVDHPAALEPGEIIAETWHVYRAHWRYLVAVAALVFVPLGVVAQALRLLGWPGLVVSTALTLAAVFLVQGTLVYGVQALLERHRPPPSIGVTFRESRRWFAPLALASILAALTVMGGLLLLIVPGLVLLTWWVVLPPVVVIEGRPVVNSFRRARALVLGHGWPVFGVAVLTMVIQLAFSLALGLATTPLGSRGADFIGVAVGNTLSAPFVAVAWTLTYFALRGRARRTAPAAE